jgi:L-amino acid N-acyltransferase YncA
VALLNPIIEAGCYTVMDEPITPESEVEFIRGLPTRSLYHVAVSDETGEALGVQDIVPLPTRFAAQRHVAEISTFVVMSTQRQGIGSALTWETLREATRLGVRKVLATVRADNRGAVAFYRRQGFRIIGTAEKHALARGEYLDEVLMERWIGGSQRRGTEEGR